MCSQLKEGFFIEAGADDFETDSNTLLFELKHNWTGILVEPNPTIFPKGFSRQRKVDIIAVFWNPAKLGFPPVGPTYSVRVKF